jgi:hypothetical protein
MDITILATILSAIASFVSILTAFGMAVYVFAVVRTELNQAKVDIKLLWIHANDDTKHFNLKMFDEFRLRMEDKFDNVEKQITGVEKQVESVHEYCDVIDHKIDALKNDSLKK